MQAYFSSRSKRPKRANRWYRILTEHEFEFIRNTHRYGVLVTIIAQIFTVDEEIVNTVVLSKDYSTYIKKITVVEKPVEGKKDEPIKRPIVKTQVPKTDRVGNA